MLKTSTGLRTSMLGSQSLRDRLSLGVINIYSGVEPATADAAATGTLLCTIRNGGVGITMDVPSNGVIQKTAAEVWQGTNVASGTATYYRHVAVGDTGAASTSEARVQGSIAVSGAELNLTSVVLANGAVQTLDFYSITLPTM